MLEYRERLPPRAAAGHVECVWAVWDREPRAGARAPERIVPDGCPELIVHLADVFARRVGERWVPQPRLFLAGTLTRPWLLRPGRRVDTVGIRFRPGAAAAVLGMSLAGTADRELPLALPILDVLRAHDGVDARLAAAGAWVASLRADAPATRPAVARIVAARGQLRIEALARELAVPRRTLERRFARELGVSPKTYARIVRLQAVLASLEAGERERAVDLALEAGYFDQPHLLRELRTLTGRRPRARRDADGELARHFTHPERLRALLAGR